jgi:hypothetical protein
MSSNYRRVSSSAETPDESASSHGSVASTSRGSHRSLSERVGDKLWAAAWVTMAVITAYWTNFWTVVLALEHEEEESSKALPNRSLLQIAALLLGIQTVLVLYLIVYLPRAKGLTDSTAWDVYCPRVIPVMTVTGILVGLILIRATWPVWGFLAPLILGLQAMGCLFAFHFVPWPF